MAEYRTYRGSDTNTELGPYNVFQYCEESPCDEPELVDHFPYQDGLLVWYRDMSFYDNEVALNCFNFHENGEGPGCGGFLLPVSARPELIQDPRYPGGSAPLRARVQSFDSTFGLDPVDEVCLRLTVDDDVCFGGTPAKPVFDDSVGYGSYDGSACNFGQFTAHTPSTGTKITVKTVNSFDNFMEISIN